MWTYGLVLGFLHGFILLARYPTLLGKFSPFCAWGSPTGHI